MINSGSFGSGYRTADGFTPPILRGKTTFLKLGLHPVDVGRRQVDLINCDNNRNLGRFSVIDRLDCLRHDPVVRGNH
jgi:hypothetical protein